MTIKHCTIIKWTKHDNTITLINNTVVYNITMPITFCTTFLYNESTFRHYFNFNNRSQNLILVTQITQVYF